MRSPLNVPDAESTTSPSGSKTVKVKVPLISQRRNGSTVRRLMRATDVVRD